MQKTKIWEVRPEDLPLRIRLQQPCGTRDYVLIQTKQGKLLLNKPIEGADSKEQ